jgi:two-component system response regulator YesN
LFEILVAEDEALEREAVRDALLRGRPGEISVREAVNGLQAVEIAGRIGLDAAFLDIRMPGMDGLEAAREMKRLRPGLPIVFLTACDNFEYARRAVKLGVDEYILKPAADEELLRALDLMLDSGRESLQPRADPSAAAFLQREISRDLSLGRMDAERAAEFARVHGLIPGPRLAAAFAIPGARVLKASPGFCRAVLYRALTYARDSLSSSGYATVEGLGSGYALILGFMRSRDAAPCRAKAMASEVRRRVIGDFGIDVAAGVYEAGPQDGALVDLAAEALRAVRLSTAAFPVVVAKGSGSPATENARKPEGSAANPAAKALAAAALEMMEERLGQDLSLERVAAGLGVSSSHLSRILVLSTSRGFSDNLAEARIKKACALLRAGSSVKEASALVGIHDPAYFSKVFKRVAGSSPTEYLQRLRKDGGSTWE